MSTPVEQAAYHVPKPGHDSNYYYLSNSYSFRRDVTNGGYDNNPYLYKHLPILAQEIGLRSDNDVPTRHGTWHIYEGLDLAIPNFPDGDTRVNEALALYERDGNLTNAILRVQPGNDREPFTAEDLAEDLEAFTKYFIERPRYFGFPSGILTQAKTHALIYSTFIPGAVIGFFAFPEGSRESASIVGMVAGPLSSGVTAGLWGLAERRARGKIPHKDEYMSGNHVAVVLVQQKEHIVQTSIQRELYSALQQRGTTLTPDQFLNDIYAQMPSVLVSKRKEEIERVKNPEKYTNVLEDEALSKMVGVAQILQSVA